VLQLEPGIHCARPVRGTAGLAARRSVHRGTRTILHRHCRLRRHSAPRHHLSRAQERAGSYGHYYVQLSEQAIEPLGEARSNVWLFSQLAQRLGFDHPGFRDNVDDLIAQGLGSEHEEKPVWFRGITLERLASEGSIRLQFPSEAEGKPFLPFAEGGYTTPSGKAEFYSESLAARGVDALPTFMLRSNRAIPATALFPLEFLPGGQPRTRPSHLPAHQRMESRSPDC
jgi:anaerobic selenocysteine-containing dehydrogenase